MAEDSKDVLMSVTLKGAQTALMGDSWSAINYKDPLMKGFFAPGTESSPTPANTLCSELMEFKFGVGISDDDRSGSSEQTSRGRGASENELHTPRGQGGKTSKGPASTPSSTTTRHRVKFETFMDHGAVDASANGSLPYDVSLDEITVTRQIDSTSTKLLEECLNRRPLDSIVIVQRKFTGAQKYREAYLRFEFSDCLLTSIDWDDEEVVKETIKFVYRKLDITYRPQSNTGRLLAPVWVKFNYPTDA